MTTNFDSNKPPVFFVMGPTASGKTDLAMELCKNIPADIISVDSTLVYRQMNIGTAKPTADELEQFPHRLVDICDPSEPYSAANFCADAEREIDDIVNKGRIPILVGGTMMYFKALLDGLADMPESDPAVRKAIAAEAEVHGWPVLHEQLKKIDPDYAGQLHPNHSQRISRALEVYRISGTTMTEFRARQASNKDSDVQLFANRFHVIPLALLPDDRVILHQRIEQRFLAMLEQGFIDEVRALYGRGDLHLDLPSMRAVGYRQVWQYLDEQYDYQTMIDKSLAATRQLAKRQLTWLRDWPDLQSFPVDQGMKQSTLQKKVELILNFLPIKSI